MNNKTLRTALLIFVGLVLISCAFGGGLAAGRYLPVSQQPVNMEVSNPDTPVTVSTPAGAEDATPSDLQTLFEPFWEVWSIVHQQYVDQPVDDLLLMRGAIRGMVDALGDQHSGYLDPQQYEDATTDLTGEYEGIGAWVDTTGEYLTIVTPMSGSPAEAAGLRPGDMIIAVDGDDMTGVVPEVARQKVLGPAGTDVILTIRREGVDEPFDVTVTRAHITVPSVESEMLDNRIAYIKINTFGDNTTSELKKALRELLDQEPVGMIVDLRYNGGGWLSTSVEVASQFIGEGVILYEQYGDGRRDTYEAIPGGMATDIPLVVLVNEGTASASEIVAGAIQDYERGKLVGVTTYGKGSVQNFQPLSDGAGGLRITIAKWLTPKERHIHEVGLTPDYIVEITEDDVANDLDPQLDKAIQVLQEMIAGGTD